MRITQKMSKRAFFLIMLAAVCVAVAREPVPGPPESRQPLTITLWPQGAPGEKGDVGPEKDATKPTDPLIAGKPVIRLTNVTRPTITVYWPSQEANTGAAVVVFPGGGYHVLAIDLEGTEVCQWLNSIGVTAVLLKYRVPSREGRPEYGAALEDAQRALGLIRHSAREWRIDPTRIGVLGFSAGGHLAAALSSFEERTYKPVDDADQVSCRPDFALLIYAYLAPKEQHGDLARGVQVTTQTPPTFLVQAEDDEMGVESSIFYYLALAKAHIPAEMHLYPAGGHGFGLRPSKATVTTWPERAQEWLRSLGVLQAPSGS
jgi:acetyl esterase/lipase